MSQYDDQLRELQAQRVRKNELEARAARLRTQRAVYADRTRELERTFLREQADVDRLEKPSLSGLFYQLLGKQDEKLSQEKWEAYAAQAKYDAAVRELADIEQELRQCEDELASIGDCDARYASILKEKARAVKDAGGNTAGEIVRMEERIAYLGNQRREVEEAIAAGKAALDTVCSVADDLNSAGTWGTVDLIGGGLISDLSKYSYLDQAQAGMDRLQSQLRRFQTELADVTVDADFQVRIDGFLQIADFFFDGLLADWMALNQIGQSQERVGAARRQIQEALDRLNALLDRIVAERVHLRHQLEDLVNRTAL